MEWCSASFEFRLPLEMFLGTRRTPRAAHLGSTLRWGHHRYGQYGVSLSFCHRLCPLCNWHVTNKSSRVKSQTTVVCRVCTPETLPWRPFHLILFGLQFKFVSRLNATRRRAFVTNSVQRRGQFGTFFICFLCVGLVMAAVTYSLTAQEETRADARVPFFICRSSLDALWLQIDEFHWPHTQPRAGRRTDPTVWAISWQPTELPENWDFLLVLFWLCSSLNGNFRFDNFMVFFRPVPAGDDFVVGRQLSSNSWNVEVSVVILVKFWQFFKNKFKKSKKNFN